MLLESRPFSHHNLRQGYKRHYLLTLTPLSFLRLGSSTSNPVVHELKVVLVSSSAITISGLPVKDRTFKRGSWLRGYACSVKQGTIEKAPEHVIPYFWVVVYLQVMQWQPAFHPEELQILVCGQKVWEQKDTRQQWQVQFYVPMNCVSESSVWRHSTNLPINLRGN